MKPTSRGIRTANRYRVLRQVIAEAPVTRPRLATATGLSMATVSTLVTELTTLGLLTRAGSEESEGRPRTLLAPHARGGTLVGVDVAETYVHVEAYDLALGLLASAEERLLPGQESDVTLVVDRIATAVRTALRTAVAEPSTNRGTSQGAGAERVLGVGVSMPGVVDREGGVSVFASNWDWHDVPLLRLLAERLPYSLYLDNPLRACATAELWFGAARGREDAAVVTLGTGVGAGLTIGGALYRGKDNGAGEWGHTTLVFDGRPCRCGNHGCVETYIGAPGIVRNLHERDPRSPLIHHGDQTATIEALARAAADGDPVAARTVGDTGRYLGAALGGLVNLLNPEVIVLGGWVAAALGQPLLEEARETAARHALARPLRGTPIVLCSLSANPVSLGAAALALEGHLSGVRPPSARHTTAARGATTTPHPATARGEG